MVGWQWIVVGGGLSLLCGCGRTPFGVEEVELSGGDEELPDDPPDLDEPDEPDEAPDPPLDLGVPEPEEPRDPGPPGPEPLPPDNVEACGGVPIFVETFDAGDGLWTLGDRWSIVPSTTTPGDAALQGTWGDFDVGCPVASEAALQLPINLGNASYATVSVDGFGQFCDKDLVWVDVRTSPDGEPTRLPTPELGQSVSTYEADLSDWIGGPDVYLTLGFYNVCGDPCGVTWTVETVVVCVEL